MNSETAKETVFGKLTGNTVTAIYTASSATYIRSITAAENTGSATPTLAVEVYDRTNSYFRSRGVTLTAGTEAVFDTPFTLPQGWSIRLTSGDAAGKIDWTVTYDDLGATPRG